MRERIKLGENPTLGMMRREFLELVRREGEMLGDIRASLDRIDGRFDGTGLRGLERRVDGLIRKIDRFRRDLPRIVGAAVREVIEPLTRKR